MWRGPVDPCGSGFGDWYGHLVDEAREVLGERAVKRDLPGSVNSTSQHYNPGSAMSTLATSILADRDRLASAHIDEASVGRWIRANIDRVNLLMDERVGIPVLSLLETFLQCRLKPRYEGFKSQRL